MGGATHSLAPLNHPSNGRFVAVRRSPRHVNPSPQGISGRLWLLRRVQKQGSPLNAAPKQLQPPRVLMLGAIK
eukprot:9472794-Pyramimonas_sp.AAC.1